MARRRRKRKKDEPAGALPAKADSSEARAPETPAFELASESPAGAPPEVPSEAPDRSETLPEAAPSEGGSLWQNVKSFIGLGEDPELKQKAANSSRKRGGLLDMLDPMLGALILALVIRYFALEAFVIPTGSMAPTLLGEHVNITCQECDADFKVASPFGNPERQVAPLFAGLCPHCKSDLSVTTTDGEDLEFACPYCDDPVRPSQLQPVSSDKWRRAFHPTCPSCQSLVKAAPARVQKWTGLGYRGYLKDVVWGDVVGGNKIVVNKTIYKWRAPRRWEVVVFKFPDDVYATYIKRLAGLPGELPALRNGDLEVDGQLQPRPHDIQEAIWIDVATRATFRQNLGSSPWQMGPGFSPLGPDFRIEALERSRDDATALRFGGQIFDNAAYNTQNIGVLPPFAGTPDTASISPLVARPVADLRIEVPFVPQQGAGEIVLRIREAFSAPGLDSLDWHDYTARIPVAEGETWQLQVDGQTLAERTLAPLPIGRAANLVLWNSDDQLVLKLGAQVIMSESYQGGTARTQASQVSVEVWGLEGQLELPSLKRDVQYVDSGTMPREPLGDDQYFVLGDNSSNSLDSRYWGGFSEDLLVGKAVAVFWPGHHLDWQVRWIR